MGSSAYHAELSASCPDDWHVLPLSEVAFFQEGPGILAKDFQDHGVPLIRLKGVEGDFVSLDGCNYLDPNKVAKKWSHFKLDRGDLIISTSASFGRVSEVVQEAEGAIAYTGLIRFRPSSLRLDRSYLRAFLSSAAFMQQVEAMASGSVIRHFGPSHLRQMALHLPPLQEQRAIGQVSDLLADRLRLLRQTNAILEAMVQALFKSWFVDFDPVRAKAEGREPEGMDATTAVLFPSEFEDSELGPIPKGWHTGALRDLVELKYGKALKASERGHGSVPVYGSGGITGMHDSALVSGPTIIVGRKGTVGSLYWQSAPCFPIDTVFYVVPRKSLHFSYSAMQRMGLQDLNTDAAVPGLNRENAYRQTVVIPPDSLLQAWDKVAVPIRQQIDGSEKRSQTLKTIRDTLLPRLISGKLRLPEAEALVEEAIA